ncbi:MAG: hybrid sensor histidine kinase/response regulator [bacterium]|nr:hybrid sensor histidine kinase/response regulator [bacterium]
MKRSKSQREEIFAELAELIKGAERCLLFLEKNPREVDPVLGEILRDIHSLKGIAGMEGFVDTGKIAHNMEALLENLEECGEECVSEENSELLLNALDLISHAVNSQKGGPPFNAGEPVEKILDQLEHASRTVKKNTARGAENGENAGEEIPLQDSAPATSATPGTPTTKLSPDASLQPDDLDEKMVESLMDKYEDRLEMIIAFKEEYEEQLVGMDTELTALESDPHNLDLLNKIFRIVHSVKGVSQSLGLERIGEMAHRMESVFDSLRKKKITLDAHKMDIIFESSDILQRMVVELPVILNVSVDEISGKLQATLDTRRADTAAAAVASAAAPGPSSPAAATAAIRPGADKKAAGVPAGKTPTTNVPTTNVHHTLRVGIGKLNEAMNLMGELVIGKIRLNHRFGDLNHIVRDCSHKSVEMEDAITGIQESMDYLGQVMKELQNGIMTLRMVPISVLFSRFPRIIRDISRKLNKEITLQLLGEDTEIDKTIVEELSDPLMHLIRNAIDHGIEGRDERIALKKPAKGTIRLSAYYEGNRVIIDIEDDGRGMDPEVLKRKAVEKGILSAGDIADMKDEDAYELIFSPGFSTKSQVSDLSGRGVGMDVVNTNISNLNGIIEISSLQNTGSKFSIKLPLTLAIIEALMVEAGGEIYAIPLSNVMETLLIETGDIQTVGNKQVLNVRDRILSVVKLEDILGIRKRGSKKRNIAGVIEWQDSDFIPVIVVGSVEQRVCIIVDRWLKKQEIVIKPLGDLLQKVDFISGGTIAGDGTVQLIVDVTEIMSSLERLIVSEPQSNLKSDEDTDSSETAPPTAGEQVGKKCLVIDDSPSMRKVITTLLEEVGISIDTAANGEEGLKKINENFYDLITTDVVMYPIDGLEVTETLRKEGKNRKTPVIVISSKSAQKDINKALSVGANEYIRKKHVKKMLPQIIKQYI